MFKDCSKAIRKAYFDMMNGTITYNGNPVPVYDIYAHDNAPDVFIVIGEQYEDDQSNYAKFVTGSVIIIDIVHRTKAAVSRDIVDDISNQIKGLLLPTRISHGLVIDSPFQVVNVFRESSTYQTFQTNVNKVLRRIERYRQEIIQDEF